MISDVTSPSDWSAHSDNYAKWRREQVVQQVENSL